MWFWCFLFNRIDGSIIKISFLTRHCIDVIASFSSTNVFKLIIIAGVEYNLSVLITVFVLWRAIINSNENEIDFLFLIIPYLSLNSFASIYFSTNILPTGNLTKFCQVRYIKCETISLILKKKKNHKFITSKDSIRHGERL